MAQPPRSSEPSLKNPIAFRVTASELADIDAAVEKYGDELPERSRGAALRRAARDVVHGVVVPLAAASELADVDAAVEKYGERSRGAALLCAARDVVHGVVVPLAEDERSKLDRLVDARRAELVRVGVRVNVTPADVLLHLLAAATVDSVKVALTPTTSPAPEKASEAPPVTAATSPAPVVVVDVAPAPEKAPPVTAATSEEAPAPEKGKAPKRKAPADPDAVRAAMVAAMAAGLTQSKIAAAVMADPSFDGLSRTSVASSLSKFEATNPEKHRPLSAERLAALAAVLTKEGHL